jgi:isoquinoline 1-oxidoreductase beta subunit
MSETEFSRRDFLASASALTGGLILSFYVPTLTRMSAALAQEPSGKPPVTVQPNAFVQISPDGKVTLIMNKLEMGQGVYTSLAQIIAEELDCDWSKVESISCKVDPVYNTPGYPMIMTGGSNAIHTNWESYRRVGAAMREMLKLAGANRWKVTVGEVRAENSYIIHPKHGKLSYGELAVEASKQPVPLDPVLKKSKDYKLIGKSSKRLDAQPKADGTAIFGIDVRLPGMLYACVAKPVVEDGKLKRYDGDAAKKISGVVDVIEFGNKVAVLATNTHAARKGQQALQAQFDLGKHSKLSTDQIAEDFKKKAQERGDKQVREDGHVEDALKKAKRVVHLDYQFPFLSHAPMEPMNCTVAYDGKKADIWAGLQMPTGDQMVAAKILGLTPDKIEMHVTYAGGSFGRRASKTSDYVKEACEIAKKVKKPVKLTWTREDDMHGGYYRPLTHHRVTMGFDSKNQLLAWDHHIVSQSIMEGSPFAAAIKNGIEEPVVEGVSDTHYAIPNFRLDQTRPESPMTTLWWRSVGHTHTGYAMETAIDEVAEITKQDPLEMRRKMLKSSPRHIEVLDLLKKQTGWGKKKPPKGRAWGLAVHESFKSVVGHVAEVSIDKNGHPIIHQVWSAVHVGQVVNPDGAATQVEGAIIFGLSAFLYQQIQVKDGVFQQNNFNDYPVMRMKEMPKVSVAFVKSDAHPTGLGEPGVPPIGPAVANAIYKLTKKRVRSLPYLKEAKV